MPVRKKRDLGDVLVEKGIIPQEILAEALETLGHDNQKTRRNLPRILVEDFRIPRDLVYSEVATFYAFKSVDLSTTSVSDEMLAFIRAEFNSLPDFMRDSAIEHRVLPFTVQQGHPARLILVTPDPTGTGVHLIARSFSYTSYEIRYMPLAQWEELWKRISIDRSSYSDKQAVLADAMEETETQEERETYEQALEDEISRSGLVDLVQSILMDAVRAGASDIHVVPRGEKTTEFHFRIDGRLILWYVHNTTRAEAVAAVVKDRAKNLDRFERNAAQDGFAQLSIDRKTIRFRVSIIPVVGKALRAKFESIVIRILQEPNLSIRIEDLGFEPYSEQCIRKALAKPHGIIIVTGPTGSGKSTTLVAALRARMDPSLNVITVEDPVEYFIDGARQVKLNPKLDFEGALRSILRHDPDIVMVGEMRDRITADIAIKLANTGHLTLSTLHTNDAPSAVSRLYKMGVEPFLIASAINLVMAQRLVRKLCPKCKRPISEPDAELLKRVGVPHEKLKTTTFYEPVGCGDCIQGYKGRIALHESLYFTKEIRRMILQSDTAVDEEGIARVATQQGMKSLRHGGVELLLNGITSLEEVVSVTTEEE
ncbi:MAG: Flp pilus assembly complex ATPase component TadA [Ignavibacteriales bacterium]|nr:Flp pilus assembly complex ATPase component TadA [Ignavibacteriales bacterium]